MEWFALIGAGCCEILGVSIMQQVAKQKRLKYILALVVSFAVSFSLLSFSMRTIPMSTAYAVWTGIGTAGAVLLGMLFYGEPREWRRLLFMIMILCSAIGLKILT